MFVLKATLNLMKSDADTSEININISSACDRITCQRQVIFSVKGCLCPTISVTIRHSHPLHMMISQLCVGEKVCSV